MSTAMIISAMIDYDFKLFNLKIEYFTVLPNLRVIPESNREIVREEDPQCLRIICRKT